MKKAKDGIVYNSLGVLLSIVALNAFGGGYYGMAGAENVPVEWLKGSPFSNYFIPSLILFFIVGGSSLIAAITAFRRRPSSRKISLLCGFIILTWIAVQLAIIGYVSWMQPATTIAAIIIILLCLQLPRDKGPAPTFRN